MKEHERLIDAIAAHDVEAAARLAREHITTASFIGRLPRAFLVAQTVCASRG